MRAGGLRDWVTIQYRTVAQAADGEKTATWANYDNDWAKVVAINQLDAFRAKQLQIETTHTFELRYRQLNPLLNRFVFENFVYNITGIKDIDGLNIGMICECVWAGQATANALELFAGIPLTYDNAGTPVTLG